MMKSNSVRAAWRWDSITIRCNDHLCVQGIRLVLYATRYESSNRKKFSLMENGFKEEEKRALQIPFLVMDKSGFK